jgi:hypothetical protein
MAKAEELVVITKAYDLILWSCQHTSRFPRQHRFVLGERIDGSERCSTGKRCCGAQFDPANRKSFRFDWRRQKVAPPRPASRGAAVRRNANCSGFDPLLSKPRSAGQSRVVEAAGFCIDVRIVGRDVRRRRVAITAGVSVARVLDAAVRKNRTISSWVTGETPISQRTRGAVPRIEPTKWPSGLADALQLHKATQRPSVARLHLRRLPGPFE